MVMAWSLLLKSCAVDAGLAVVLRDGPAAVWTDSRYFLQAEQELDCNWQLVKTLRGAVSLPKWAGLYLPRGSKLAADPRLVPQGQWLRWSERLRQHNITLETDTGNLVDDIWTRAQGRPAPPTGHIEPYPLKYSGSSYWTIGMVATIRLCATGLFNLRGSDTPDSPVFKAFTFVSREEIRYGSSTIEITPYIQVATGVCSSGTADLPAGGRSRDRSLERDEDSCQDVRATTVSDNSMALNDTDHCPFRRQDLCRGDSFPTVSAVDANAAIVHYIPRNVTNKQLKSNSILLLDTGGQYLSYLYRSWERHGDGQPAQTWDVLVQWSLCIKYLSELTSSSIVMSEPGYYEEGKFGIRLETTVTVVEAKTK
ncbi:XPNPEP1, partial [Cordylochernes scorpioides]